MNIEGISNRWYRYSREACGVIAMNIEGISNALCRLGTGNKGVIAMNLSRTRKL